MNKDLLEECQNDECVKSCEECDDFERWVKDEN